MINSFMAANEMHAIYLIHQKSMTKIGASSFCNIEGDVGPGIYQMPDWAFDGARSSIQLGTNKIPVCLKCAGIVTRMKTPPK